MIQEPQQISEDMLKQFLDGLCASGMEQSQLMTNTEIVIAALTQDAVFHEHMAEAKRLTAARIKAAHHGEPVSIGHTVKPKTTAAAPAAKKRSSPDDTLLKRLEDPANMAYVKCLKKARHLSVFYDDEYVDYPAAGDGTLKEFYLYEGVSKHLSRLYGEKSQAWEKRLCAAEKMLIEVYELDVAACPAPETGECLELARYFFGPAIRKLDNNSL